MRTPYLGYRFAIELSETDLKDISDFLETPVQPGIFRIRMGWTALAEHHLSTSGEAWRTITLVGPRPRCELDLLEALRFNVIEPSQRRMAADETPGKIGLCGYGVEREDWQWGLMGLVLRDEPEPSPCELEDN